MAASIGTGRPWRTGRSRPCNAAPAMATARRGRTIPGQENARAAATRCAKTRAPRGAMAAAVALLATPAAAQQAITLHGAVQFNDDHAFNKALLKFEERVKAHYGKPINFVLHRNSELGLEKDY